MAKGEFIKGLPAQRPYDQGVTEAMLAGYGLIGKPAPAYVALPALPVTKDNLLDAWQQIYHQPPTAKIKAEHEIAASARGPFPLEGRDARFQPRLPFNPEISRWTHERANRPLRRPHDAASPSISAACARSTTSSSTSAKAKFTRCSARTARANRRS